MSLSAGAVTDSHMTFPLIHPAPAPSQGCGFCPVARDGQRPARTTRHAAHGDRVGRFPAVTFALFRPGQRNRIEGANGAASQPKGKVMSEPTKQPTLAAYTIRKYKQGNDDKQQWTRIGHAFPHKDGQGYDIVLQALPVDGRVILRKPLPKEGGDMTGPSEA
jgi:hypothetical protein